MKPADERTIAGSLAGKVAVVTGAAQGAGRAYARALAQEGATVVALSRSLKLWPAGSAEADPSTLSGLAREARLAGEPINVQTCDVGDEAQIVRCVDETVANHSRIDIVVNNAATYPEDQPQPHYDMLGLSTAEWDRYLRVNLIGPYAMIRAVLPHMIAQKCGSIVNITSKAALGVDWQAAQHGMLAYVTSKAALNRMTQFVAAEVRKHGIAVNALCPGMVITNSWRGISDEMQQEMLRSGRGKKPTPEAMGPALLYLARQTADTFTGQIVSTDDFGASWP